MLGIGDRHLNNLLIHTPSGRILPIDFGHAFGTATTLLPIPELMPFRMTRQVLQSAVRIIFFMTRAWWPELLFGLGLT